MLLLLCLRLKAATEIEFSPETSPGIQANLLVVAMQASSASDMIIQTVLSLNSIPVTR